MKDFRRQALVELQKAVAASETKAREMLAVDRMKMEQTLEEVRRKTRDEITHLLSKQEDSDEVCLFLPPSAYLPVFVCRPVRWSMCFSVCLAVCLSIDKSTIFPYPSNFFFSQCFHVSVSLSISSIHSVIIPFEAFFLLPLITDGSYLVRA